MTLIRTVEPQVQQQIGIRQRLVPATCAEVDCALYREGQTFWVAHLVDPATGRLGRYIHHAAGAECGPRCPNDICPCVNTGPIRGAGGYPHVKADQEHVPGYTVREYGRQGRPLGGHVAGESEALDRLGEGVEAVRFALLRGV